MHLKGWLFVSLIAGTCLVLQIKNAKSQGYDFDPYSFYDDKDDDKDDGYIDPVPDIGPVKDYDIGSGDLGVLSNRIDNLENALQTIQTRMQEILSRQQPTITCNKCLATLNRELPLRCPACLRT